MGALTGVARLIFTPSGFSSIIISRGIHSGTCYTEQIVITSRQMYKNSITKSSHLFFFSYISKDEEPSQFLHTK